MNMIKVFKKFLATKYKGYLKPPFSQRSLHEYFFDTDEEVIESYLGSVMMIGINLPDRKNILTETAVDKLYKSVQKLNIDDDICVAVLHGCGGNFCTGLEQTEKALEKGQQLIMELSQKTKPVIASLNGSATNFGFVLAIMCDLKAMDETAMAGFGWKDSRSHISPIVYKNFAQTVGRANAMEMILTNCTWSARRAQETGFVNRTVDCGSALGQAMSWAQSIALRPLKIVREEKYKFEKYLS